MYKNCSFTGHRVLDSRFDPMLLDRVVINLIKSGARNFYCGMATGFDMESAEVVLKYKEIYNLRLCACIPCEEQSRYYSVKDKKRYEKILCACDEKIVFSEEYNSWCMQERDRFLVDNCDVLVAYLRKKSGGTYYTVNYAKKTDKKIIEL